MAKVKKKTAVTTIDRNRYNMKIVASETCIACKQKCARGIRYIEHMSESGARGHGALFD